jgi:hypothetical protein
MSPLRRAPFLLLPVLVALAFAIPAEAQRAQSEQRDPRRLSHVELTESNSRDALDAIRKLRPHWLSTRGQQSFRTQPTVRLYVDGVPRRSIEELRQIQPGHVRSIEYLNGGEATTRWGTGHAAGAIVVLMVGTH